MIQEYTSKASKMKYVTLQFRLKIVPICLDLENRNPNPFALLYRFREVTRIIQTHYFSEHIECKDFTEKN